MYNNITGFILAGGKSQRMGTNKSLLMIGSLTVIERVVNLIRKIFREVIIITNQPGEYSFLELPTYEDIYKNTGPLAGIHSALVHTSTEKNFIISCDMPLMTEDVIKYLAEYPTNKLITIAKADEFVQQLCGLYSKSLVPNIKNIIEMNMSGEDERNTKQEKRGCSVLELIKNVPAEIINIEKEYKDYRAGTFYNMNRPEEYNFILDSLL